PEISAPLGLARVLAARDPARLLVFCDENAEVRDPVAALPAARAPAPMRLAVLVGPEGGFAEDERAALLKAPNVVRLALGPRILRADTAAVAALALVAALLGGWRWLRRLTARHHRKMVNKALHQGRRNSIEFVTATC